MLGRLLRIGRATIFLIIFPAMFSYGGWLLAAAGDRLIAPRHGTTITLEERFHDPAESRPPMPGTYGVWVIRNGGDRRRVHSDQLYDEFANTGRYPAEATGWLDQIVAVAIDGRRIEVGQSLRFRLMWGSFLVACCGFMVILVGHGGARYMLD